MKDTMPTNNTTLSIELTPCSFELIQRASQFQGCSMSDFIVSCSQKEAEKIINNDLVILSAQDQIAFVEHLLNPNKERTPAFIQAMAVHDQLINQSDFS